MQDSGFPYSLKKFSAFDLDLLIPDPDDVKTIYEKGKTDGLDPLFPYWTKIWPSAMAMAEFIGKNSDLFAGKKVLELGAGLGLPSFIVSRYAKFVTASDYIDPAVRLLKLNAVKLKIDNLVAKKIDWNNVDLIKEDIILMSDINYAPEEFSLLFKIISDILGSGATIVLSTPQRLMAKTFVEVLVPYIAYRESVEVWDTEILIVVLKNKGDEYRIKQKGHQ